MKKILLLCSLILISCNSFAASNFEKCVKKYETMMNCGLTDNDVPEIVKYLRAHADDGTGGMIINLSGNKLTDKGLLQIIGQVKNIKGVDISGNKITDKSAIPLVSIKSMEWVEMNHTKISDETVKAIANNKNIWWMELSNNHITDAGVKAFKGRKELDTVDLSGNHITDKGAAILGSIYFLGHLYLDHNNIGDAGAIALAKLGSKLSLKYNHITDKGALAIIQSEDKFNYLFNLEGNLLTDRTAEVLASYESPQYTHLYIGANKITLDGIRKLIQSKKFSQINVNNSHYGNEVAEIFGNTSYKDAGLSGNNITDEGVAALMKNQQWERLELEDNAITDAGLAMVLTLPAFHPTKALTGLYLARNKITDVGINALLTQDIYIEAFTIRGNPVSEKAIKSLQNSKQIGNLIG